MYLHACSIYAASKKCARPLHGCTFEIGTLLFCRRCKISDRVWRPEFMQAHRRPHYDCRRFFCARESVLWRLCAGYPRVCRVPLSPVRQPAYSCHPYSFDGDQWQLPRQRSFAQCTPPIRPKFAPPLIELWLSPLYTPTPASLHVLPATTTTWPKPAHSKQQGLPNEQRPELRPA